jgi:hypothetical protein
MVESQRCLGLVVKVEERGALGGKAPEANNHWVHYLGVQRRGLSPRKFSGPVGHKTPSRQSRSS